MTRSRRSVVAGGAALGASSLIGIAWAESASVIAFDAFPIFDPRPVAGLVRSRFRDKGDALAALWSSKLFAATWLVTAADHYETFETLADATLRASARSLGVVASARDRDDLVASYGQLSAWPDVAPGLARLKAAGHRLALLSNLGESTLRSNMARAGLSEAFDAVLSTDRVKHFKPSPAAYAMATDTFRVPRTDVAFAAFAGWDAVGATWFGYRTAWINRLDAPAEPTAAQPAIVARDFGGVMRLAGTE